MNTLPRARYVLALLGALAFAALAHAAAGTAVIAYSAPTTLTDGTALPASALTQFEAECMQSAPGGALTPCTPAFVSAPGTARSIPVTVTYPAATGARLCLRVRAYAGGPAGDWSAQGCKDFAALGPSAPGNITITVTVAIITSP